MKAMNMRKAASIAFHETECEDALRRAILSGPRPCHNFEIGETVYFWRVGQGPKWKRAPTYWHGPAKTVMTNPPTTIWLSYQGRLVKASPERVRRASEDEQTTLTGWIDDLVQTRNALDREPKRGFLDLSDDPLPPEDEELLDGEQEDDDYEQSILPDEEMQKLEDRKRPWQGPIPEHRRRLRGKTDIRNMPEQTLDELHHELLPEDRAPADRALPSELPGPPEPELSPDYQEPADLPQGEESSNITLEPDGGHKRERELQELPEQPETKRMRTEYLEIYLLKVNQLVQSRQKKEIRLNEMNKKNKECFLKATMKEITNNINIGAYKPISLEESARVRQQEPEKVMSSRYVVTAKPLEAVDVGAAKVDGLLLEWNSTEPHKAKVRRVMQGYSEHGSEYLNSTTPQVTRDGVMFTVQIIASMKWKLGFLDFTQAFHSGDGIQRTIFAEQPHEGVPGLVRGQLLRLLKTCYGLTDGPFAWFSHITRVILDLGYEASKADPCLFYLFTYHKGKKTLSGIIAMATDDLLHGGDQEHLDRMEQLKKKYKMGKCQFEQGRFCGKNYKTLEDGSIKIDQENFVQEKIQVIPLTTERRRQRYSKCTSEEISALRGLLGSLAWLAKETRPDIAGRVALLQQTLPTPRIRDIIEANLVAAEAYKNASSGIRITPIEIVNLRVGVVSDASWGNSQGQSCLEKDGPDYWEETPTSWIRHHITPRSTTFHPAASPTGPDLHDLLPERVTEDGTYNLKDNWTTNRGVTATSTQGWTGTTTFYKQPDGKKLSHDNINELFLQLLNTSSQGGSIILYYDKQLETSNTPRQVSITSWKSTRLKRKTVNTLSAECQSMVQAVGTAHWHRFLLLEALGHELKQDEWERQLASIPYVAITDSKSLFDCLNKTVCTYTQADDKRTAIDIAMLKDDLQKSGGHPRWIEGSNMLSDPLTKKMKGEFLRRVANNSFWALSFAGHEKLCAEHEILLICV